jgi:hypothetical protein
MSWVFAHAPKDLRPAEMLVAIALANHASSDGGHAYPSVQTLMDETRLTRRSVQGALRSLEERDVIAVEREATRRLPAMYGFVAFRGAEFAPHMEEGAQTVQSGAQSMHVRGANSAPKPSEEPSEEPSVTPLYPPVSKKNGRKTTWDEAWERPASWNEYAMSKHGMNAAQIETHWFEFTQHWLSNGFSKADWLATWRVWLTRVPRFAPRMNGHGATKPEDRRPAIPTLEQVLQPPKSLSDAKRAELAAIFAERRQGR